jgi:nickel-dependent lactate racemase
VEILVLKYGQSTMSVRIPRRSLFGVLRPAEPDMPKDERGEIERALNEPIGSDRIQDIARPGARVTIMVSDATRPAPSHKMLPPLLQRLRDAGIDDGDITIVFGMGIHRAMIQDEKRTLVGPEVYARYKCVESTHSGEYVYLGTTSRGTPVEVCPEVHSSDILICTGNIEYHYFAGYSGGSKAVLPGACSRRTVEANHSMQFLPGAELGSYEDNPVRQDIEEAGRIIGVDFILNVVLDEKKRIVKAVAGDPVAAFQAGRRVADQVYGVPIERQADIVLASAGGRPKDLNLYQAQKALTNAARAVREGGVVILVAECPEGLGEKGFQEYMTTYPPAEIIRRISDKFVLGAHKAAAVARVLMRTRVFLVSSIAPDLVASCGMTPFQCAQEGFSAAYGQWGCDQGSRDASVLVMPYAGSTVPRPI